MTSKRFQLNFFPDLGDVGAKSSSVVGPLDNCLIKFIDFGEKTMVPDRSLPEAVKVTLRCNLPSARLASALGVLADRFILESRRRLAKQPSKPSIMFQQRYISQIWRNTRARPTSSTLCSMTICLLMFQLTRKKEVNKCTIITVSLSNHCTSWY